MLCQTTLVLIWLQVRLFDGIFSKNPKRKSKNQNRLNSKIQSLHGKRIAPFC
jgi:hypothetical protein